MMNKRRSTSKSSIKWFIGYGLEEKTPHFSDFSKTYIRKFSKEIEIKDDKGNIIEKKSIFTVLFDEVIEQAMECNYIYLGHIYMDSTHIKANANKKKVTKQMFCIEHRDRTGKSA
ncbi:hypothetical protein [Absiella sp. AM29-15]|uniref:hypothetical protein n=1 Tax=Absiella sp. AM29-15 TaxID=2292278 RepID=UPI0011C0E13F|nr:hypothetical protein [Absiella sp. AM29-15]